MNIKFWALLFPILTLFHFSIYIKAEIEMEVQAIYKSESNLIIYNGEVYSRINSVYTLEEIPSTSTSPIIPNLTNNSLWLLISIIVLITLFAGIMSGLTVGYLSIDDLVLELKSKTGTDIEQLYSSRILPIISKRHWLLVTLLLFNATAMEALPLFLNRLVDEYMAVIISVTLVLFFGEIIPQAMCTGPSQLKIASFLAPLTTSLMYISAPVSYPIASILDFLVGRHSKSRFVNTDLKGLIELHTLEALDKLSKEQGQEIGNTLRTNQIGLHNEQADLMISALKIKEIKAEEIMIPLENVFMLDCDAILDLYQVGLILDKGFSRIPVFCKERNNILGILRIKQLIGIDVSQGKSLSQLLLKLSAPIVVHPSTPALELMNEFKKGKSHMSFITAEVDEFVKSFEISNSGKYKHTAKGIISKTKGRQIGIKVLGMVTLEDVIEKMINIEILDEDDYARNKILHEKNGTKNKNKFYKDAITKEFASFMEDNKEKLNLIIDNSYKNQPMLLGDHSLYEIDPSSINLREPLL